MDTLNIDKKIGFTPEQDELVNALFSDDYNSITYFKIATDLSGVFKEGTESKPDRATKLENIKRDLDRKFEKSGIDLKFYSSGIKGSGGFCLVDGKTLKALKEKTNAVCHLEDYLKTNLQNEINQYYSKNQNYEYLKTLNPYINSAGIFAFPEDVDWGNLPRKFYCIQLDSSLNPKQSIIFEKESDYKIFRLLCENRGYIDQSIVGSILGLSRISDFISTLSETLKVYKINVGSLSPYPGYAINADYSRRHAAITRWFSKNVFDKNNESVENFTGFFKSAVLVKQDENNSQSVFCLNQKALSKFKFPYSLSEKHGGLIGIHKHGKTIFIEVSKSFIDIFISSVKVNEFGQLQFIANNKNELSVLNAISEVHSKLQFVCNFYNFVPQLAKISLNYITNFPTFENPTEH